MPSRWCMHHFSPKMVQNGASSSAGRLIAVLSHRCSPRAVSALCLRLREMSDLGYFNITLRRVDAKGEKHIMPDFADLTDEVINNRAVGTATGDRMWPFGDLINGVKHRFLKKDVQSPKSDLSVSGVGDCVVHCAGPKPSRVPPVLTVRCHGQSLRATRLTSPSSCHADRVIRQSTGPRNRLCVRVHRFSGEFVLRPWRLLHTSVASPSGIHIGGVAGLRWSSEASSNARNFAKC